MYLFPTVLDKHIAFIIRFKESSEAYLHVDLVASNEVHKYEEIGSSDKPCK